MAVVESFGMLDAFHPGRIVLGVGRSGHRVTEARQFARARRAAAEASAQWREVDGIVISPPVDRRSLLRSDRLRTTLSLLQQPHAVSPDFATQPDEIQPMLAGTRSEER